jgi:ATP-dependent DNA helicase PIF1
VDAYAQVEQNRLDFLRFNQDKIRSEVYRGIVDAAIHGIDLSTVGNLSILPSSFKGGPREMWQLYQDAMAIVRYCGKPDLFITMTCNPLWAEISEELLPGQTAQDRPELVARVFKLKLNALIQDLTKKMVFGKVVAFVYVVEFQKRGLPHAHILLILDPSDKPHTSAEIDSIVCAEIPSQTDNHELYNTVISSMLHGPCGTARPTAPCMKDGKCSKRYPKSFSDETLPEVDGYPVYRRRNDGVTVHKHGHVFTNEHVVPYNPYLSRKYNCHINVEIATSITAVKYLFKYVYKGHDRASICIVNHQGSDEIDEISEYLDSRYISAAESCWRIFGFRMHQHSPSVTRLQLHLPEMQQVRFNPETETVDHIIQRANIHQTTLNAFFDTCRMQPDITGDLLYPDFPSRFTWDPKLKVWNPRKNYHSTIGRVTFCPPSSGERYYLRMLLYSVRGPHSFEGLKTYNGHVCPMSQLIY